MTIQLEVMFIGGLSILITVVAWFIKRDIARFERVLEKHASDLSKHAESLATIMQQVTSALEVAKWTPNLQRFFGDGGGNARIWKAIESLQFDMEQSRERHHWMANKMAILKGSMEVQGMKCGDPAGWVIPEWKLIKEKDVKP